MDGIADLAAGDACQTVVAAIVGAAGLDSTLAAARAGKRLLLANKESLVLAGELLMAAARDGGACIVPIDSEHNAIFQCLPADAAGDLRRLNRQGVGEGKSWYVRVDPGGRRIMTTKKHKHHD